MERTYVLEVNSAKVFTFDSIRSFLIKMSVTMLEKLHHMKVAEWRYEH